jgi:transcriptional regulator with XRE-family HTH domain
LIDVANGKPKNLIVPPRRAAFAERIKALREAAGLTQTELAKRAGIDRSYYAEVEAGQHSVSIDRVFAIADALDVPAHLLFTEDPVELGEK